MGMDHILKWHHFHTTTGLLLSNKLEARGIFSDGFDGCFWANRRVELLAICEQQPTLHMISLIDMTSMNRYEPNADFYYLGDGSKDPTMEITHHFPTQEEWALALEEALRVPENERTGFDRLSIAIFSAGAGNADLSDARVLKGVIK